ncbi:hypothetical protein M9Y10_045927 [Tritrichomonas musculus]|uniref:Small GTP-binding protein n=1 Tax=Tritrichomonas musculus TaxID=1915356 RepID=A0ABR2JWY2_9EUKA
MSGATIRVIFVGNTNVGKTALNTRYLQNDFNPEGAPTISPASSSVTAKTTTGKEVTLQLWDTAGQERFQSLSQVFYREANVAIICVDGSDPDSFNSVRVWASRVREFEPNCKFVLAVTKIDLVEDRTSIVQLATQTAAEEEMPEGNVFYTSSKTGECVQELFAYVATLGDKKVGKVETENSNNNSQSQKPASPPAQSVSLTEGSQKKKKGCC